MRIALIDNLSARGYRLIPPPEDARLEFMSPTSVSRAANLGTCDAALLPAVWTQRLPAYEPAGAFGIACHGKVGSVTLFSRLHIHVVLRSGLGIHVTPASQTSVRLLHVLANRTFGLTPMLVETPHGATASLLIGDEAVAMAESRSWPYACDLCGWWSASTGLPFVFARWMMRKNLAKQQKHALLAWLSASAQAAESEVGRAILARTCDGPSSWRANAPAYYQHLRLRLGDAELSGQRTFLRALEEQDQWSKIA